MRLLILLLAALIGCEQLFPPGPIVNPPVPVVPITGTVWAIVLEETAERTPATALILADDDFWASHKVTLRPYDIDSPDAAKYVAATAGVARPTLLLLGSDGARLAAVPLPTDTAGVEAVLRGIGR